MKATKEECPPGTVTPRKHKPVKKGEKAAEEELCQ